MKKIIYLDMDGVLVDFQSGIDRLDEPTVRTYADRLDEVPGIFGLMEPMPGAFDAVRQLSDRYDLYILSTAPWLNPSAWTDKINWIHKHFGKEKESLFYKRLTISHRKDLLMGDYLIDDRPKNGAEQFSGEWIHFGSPRYPGWKAVLDYLA